MLGVEWTAPPGSLNVSSYWPGAFELANCPLRKVGMHERCTDIENTLEDFYRSFNSIS